MNPQEETADPPSSAEDRIVRAKELQTLDGLSATERQREINAGRYPAPFKLSSDPKTRAVGWSFLAIQRWIAERRASVEVDRAPLLRDRMMRSGGGS